MSEREDEILSYRGPVKEVREVWMPRAGAAPRLIVWIGVSLAIVVVWFLVTPRPFVRDTNIRGRATEAEMENLSVALVTFRVDTRRFPTTAEGLDALVTAPAVLGGWRGPYVNSVPEDKWGHAYRYVFPSAGDPTKFELRSAGADGVSGTGDDLVR